MQQEGYLGYRLEVSLEEYRCTVTGRYEPTELFDRLHRLVEVGSNDQLKVLVQAAIKYVDNAFARGRQPNKKYSLPSPPKTKAYCSRGHKCAYADSRQRCRYGEVHATTCPVGDCGFFERVELKLWDVDGHRQRYTVACRKEGTRDIIFAPLVTDPPLNAQLHDNFQLASSPAFWQDVLTEVVRTSTKIGLIPAQAVSLLALNFGNWETAVQRNEYAHFCHGHCHWILTQDAIEQLEKIYPVLKSCREPTEEDVHIDCEKLVRERITMYQGIILQENIDGLRIELNDVKAELNDVKTELNDVKTELKGVNEQIGSLSSNLEKFMATVLSRLPGE